MFIVHYVLTGGHVDEDHLQTGGDPACDINNQVASSFRSEENECLTVSPQKNLVLEEFSFERLDSPCLIYFLEM